MTRDEFKSLKVGDHVKYGRSVYPITEVREAAPFYPQRITLDTDFCWVHETDENIVSHLTKVDA
jgi:hypothetical protein